MEEGERELSRKCPHNSDIWFVYFDYAQKELLNYKVKKTEKQEDLGNDKYFPDEYALRVSPTNEFLELVLNR